MLGTRFPINTWSESTCNTRRPCVATCCQAFNGPFGKIVAGLIAEDQSQPSFRDSLTDGSPRRTATIADLQRGKNAGKLRSETVPELLNDAIMGVIYSGLLLRSGPLTRRFGEEVVEQVLREHRHVPGQGRSD